MRGATIPVVPLYLNFGRAGNGKEAKSDERAACEIEDDAEGEIHDG
jgi:hypothetical protein